MDSCPWQYSPVFAVGFEKKSTPREGLNFVVLVLGRVVRGTLLRVAPKPAVVIGVVVGPTEMKPFPPPLTLVSLASSL